MGEGADAKKRSRHSKIGRAKSKKLLESDFLLGVFDGHRIGAIRFKLEAAGPFLNDTKAMATPPWT